MMADETKQNEGTEPQAETLAPAEAAPATEAAPAEAATESAAPAEAAPAAAEEAPPPAEEDEVPVPSNHSQKSVAHSSAVARWSWSVVTKTRPRAAACSKR